MIKVLLVSTNADEAGAPRHVEGLVSLLGEEIDFYCIFGEHGSVSRRLSLRLKEKVYILKGMQSSLNFIKDFFLFFKFLFLVQKVKPDIIHCHSSKAGIYGRALSLFSKKRILMTIHGWPWRGFNGWKYKLIIAIEKFFMNFSNCHYIGVAYCLIEEAKEVGLKIKKSKFSLIYNTSLTFKNLNKLKEHSIFDENYFLMPARVSSAKNHKKLAEAFDKSYFKGKLVFAGEGTNSKKFQDTILSIMEFKKNDIFFLGERNDIQNLIYNANFVALCSNFETFPLIIPEASSISKPLILSKVGGSSEVLTDRYDAVLAESLDEWTEGINFLSLKENIDFLSKNLGKTYKNILNPNKVKVELISLYSKLIRKD
tara:strand:- start:6842 stop:7948 length:1107 start_codon:yes stop_codon:yes gene_type:complete